MHISNLFGQYQRNFTSNSTDELKGASSMQKLVSSVSELTQGSVFEGTVSSVRGGKVTLSLSTGQTIMAQLSGKVQLTVGQPMFFQVKSNEGGVLSIRPYNREGAGSNPILLNALTSAGVPVTERNLSMVNSMMHQQMPISKQSILDMVKFVNANEDVSVQTVVDMVRLGLPVDTELAAQFERYQMGEYELLGKMDTAIDQMTNLLSDENILPDKAVEMNHKLLDVILKPNVTSEVVMDDVEQFLLGNGGDRQATGTIANDVNQPLLGIDGSSQNAGTVMGDIEHLLLGSDGGKQAAATVELHTGVSQQSGSITTASLIGQTLQEVFSETQLEQLTKVLQGTPSLVDKPELFMMETSEEVFVDTMEEETTQGGNGMPTEVVAEQMPEKQKVNAELTVGRFLKLIQEGLANHQEYGFAGVQKLFGSKEYKEIVKELLKEQWLIKPEELQEEGKLKESVERLLQQTNNLEQIVKSVGLEQNQLLNTTADIRGNVDFMNQINQLYTFVQLPLKMSGQNANGELYVYTNKKNLKDPDTELSAFLHLDLEHLGSTDVSVKLLKKNVKTNFYFSDDESFELVQKYLPILETKLKQKGYNCTFSVTNEKKQVDFVKDFLRKDLPPAGTLHRYSFDVRT